METKSDPSKRMRFMMELVGFTDADQRALLDSVPVLGPVLPRLLDASYDHLLSHDTRRIFLGQRGEVEPDYVALRKEHLTQWVLRTAGVTGEVQRFGQAWAKMLVVQLEMFLKVMAPHWPAWDESA